MERHWPAADLRETEENARVAVSSRGLASAAADGLRTPPALATETSSLVDVDGSAAGAELLSGVSVSLGHELGDEAVDEAGEAGADEAGADEAGAGEADPSPKLKD